MPRKLEHRGDIEAELDNDSLSKVRFGRSRFLRLLGASLFGFAALGAVESAAEARPRLPTGACGTDETPPTHQCNNCHGGDPGRKSHLSPGTCPGSGNCWYETHGHQKWKCCDFVTRTGDNCFCPKYIGRV